MHLLSASNASTMSFSSTTNIVSIKQLIVSITFIPTEERFEER